MPALAFMLLLFSQFLSSAIKKGFRLASTLPSVVECDENVNDTYLDVNQIMKPLIMEEASQVKK